MGSGAGRGAGGEPGSTLRRAEGESRRAGEGDFLARFVTGKFAQGLSGRVRSSSSALLFLSSFEIFF